VTLKPEQAVVKRRNEFCAMRLELRTQTGPLNWWNRESRPRGWPHAPAQSGLSVLRRSLTLEYRAPRASLDDSCNIRFFIPAETLWLHYEHWSGGSRPRSKRYLVVPMSVAQALLQKGDISGEETNCGRKGFLVTKSEQSSKWRPQA